MDTEQHIRQGQHNEATSEYLAGTPYNDWRCTILFYAALHYIQAYFAAKTPRQRFGTHVSRDNAIQLDSGINAIYRSYRSLKDSSRFARYEGWNPTDEQMNREVKLALDGIKGHLRKVYSQNSIAIARLLGSRPSACDIMEVMSAPSNGTRHVFQTDDARLRPIHDKVMAQERLSEDDALALYASGDILALGWLANHVRERMHGDIAYFNVNRHINYTNVCVAACRLCAFGRKKDTPGAYTMALEEVWNTAASGYTEAITEFHIVGGLHADLPFQYYIDLIAGLKERFPQVHLKAFTMVEIAFFSKIGKMTPREVLVKFKEAGLDSMPGGGAEIFSDRIRHIICDHKIDGDQWLELARTAHEIGLKSNATMLYGHVENDEDRVDHLLKLRALQDDTRGFQTFIPLAFHPANTPLQHLPTTTGMGDLKQIAIGRLVLDNFPHIKSYWQMVTPKMAQITLRFGADDIDGTVVEEKIYHDAGATTPQGLRRQDLIRLITEAGRVPFERDTLYRPVTRTETTVTVAV